MVFSGNKRIHEEQQHNMERLNSKPLHNFDLPYLKWGNQKLLRCMPIDSIPDSSIVARHPSPDTAGHGAGHTIATRRRDSHFDKKRSRSRSNNNNNNNHNNNKVLSSERIINDEAEEEISATRVKLLTDFKKQVGEMKEAILGTKTTSYESLVTNGDGEVIKHNSTPWNLRTRRVNGNGNGEGNVLKANCSSPLTNGDGERKEREKFSVSLSRRQVEEDFMAMAGRRLPRKPKKRPRIVQKQLDTLFPGLWLSEITADLYKVPDEAETGKR